MKSSMIKSRRFLECDCYSPDHLLIVDVLEEDEQPDDTKGKIWLAEVAFLSDYRMPWYKRVYYAFHFIFFKRGYYISDSICISERNIEQLEDLVGIFKEQQKHLSALLEKDNSKEVTE